jgi:hypothetical protein
MHKSFLSKPRALLLFFFFVNYSFAGTIPDQNQTSPVIKKYGIDENGRSFEYTVPTATSPALPAASSRLPPPKTTKYYGIDQNGRSFEYDENLLSARPPALAARPAPARQVAVTAPKPAIKVTTKTPVVAQPAVTKVPAHKPAPEASRPAPVAQKSMVRQQLTATARTPVPAKKPAVVAAVPAGIEQSETPIHVVALVPETVVEAATLSHEEVVAALTASSENQGNAEFLVKVSAGNNPSTNRLLERDLKKLGVSSIKSRIEREDKPVHRLLYARHQDRSRAYLDVKILHSSGQNAYIISKNGDHSVYCGSFYLEERAEAEQKEIADKGIRVTIAKASVLVTNKFYMAGGFRSRGAADKLAGMLQQRGMSTTVVTAEPYLAQKSKTDDIRG